MKVKIKIAIIGMLVFFAVFLCAFAVIDNIKTSDGEETASCLSESQSDTCYVLRDYEGYVAVYVENDPSRPMTVTDIQVSTLRELDKKLLETGLKLYSREKLMMTLEDLGS